MGDRVRCSGLRKETCKYGAYDQKKPEATVKPPRLERSDFGSLINEKVIEFLGRRLKAGAIVFVRRYGYFI